MYKGVLLFLLSLITVGLPAYAAGAKGSSPASLQQALRALEQVKRHLQPGAVSGSHQARALFLTEEAIREVRAAEAHAVQVTARKKHTGVWTLIHAQVNCEAMRPNDCRGMYGFTVTPDGRFTVGNGEIGQTLNGSITAPERNRLDQLVGAFTANATRQAPTCLRAHTVPGLHDRIELTAVGGTPLRVYDRGSLPGKFCFLGRQQKAQELHDVMQQLMGKYYPVPFPK